MEQVITDERPQQRGAHRNGGDCSLLLRIFLGDASRKIEQKRLLPEVKTHRLPLTVETHAGVQTRRVKRTPYAWKGGAYELPVVGQKRLKTTENQPTTWGRGRERTTLGYLSCLVCTLMGWRRWRWKESSWWRVSNRHATKLHPIYDGCNQR